MEYHGTWNNNSSFLLRQYRPRPVRVFLVDDDLPYLKKAQRKLVSFGCLVKCFDSAKFAKRELNKAEGKVDIVFTDVYTRAMDGFELLDKIKERWNDLPVVMMTVDSNPVIIKRATQQNASFFASKANIDNVLSNFARYVNWVRKATVVDTDHIDVHDQDTNNNGSSTTTTALTMDGWNEMRLIERKGRKRNDDVYWCPSLRNKFFRAVNKLNFTRVIPTSIMKVMKEPRLSRGKVNSHLQKYRKFIKKVSIDIERINLMIKRHYIPHAANIPNQLHSGQQTQMHVLQQASSSVPFGSTAQVTTHINGSHEIPPSSMVIGSSLPHTLYNTYTGGSSGYSNSTYCIGESSRGPYNNPNLGGSCSGQQIGNYAGFRITDHNNFSPGIEIVNNAYPPPLGHETGSNMGRFQLGAHKYNGFSSGLMGNSTTCAPIPEAPLGNYKDYNVYAPINSGWESQGPVPSQYSWGSGSSGIAKNMMTNNTSPMLGESSSTTTTAGIEFSNHGFCFGESSNITHTPTIEASVLNHNGYNITDSNVDSSGNISVQIVPDPVSESGSSMEDCGNIPDKVVPEVVNHEQGSSSLDELINLQVISEVLEMLQQEHPAGLTSDHTGASALEKDQPIYSSDEFMLEYLESDDQGGTVVDQTDHAVDNVAVFQVTSTTDAPCSTSTPFQGRDFDELLDEYDFAELEAILKEEDLVLN